MTGMLLLLLLGYWPLPANQGITGTFMEYRNQHLHAGFDLSTGGKVGLPVHCFADGEIVLIKVQKRGYGRVLYVRHPKKKLVSVYGHLDRFMPRLEKLVTRYRKRRHSRYPGTIVPKHPIPVKKGEIIAYSGESGVGWPHLHFELRNFQNEPVNPVPLGFSVKRDSAAPKFQYLNIYPETPFSAVNGVCKGYRIPVKRAKSGSFTVPRVQINGPVLFTATIRDTDGRKGPIAVYSITVKLNKTTVYQYCANRFSYDRFNRSSAVYDIGRTRLSPSTYSFNLFRVPGANLVSQKSFQRHFKKGENRLQVIATDFAGHKARLDFHFTWKKNTSGPYPPETFTTSALLTKGKVLPAANVRQPVSVRIAHRNWKSVSYDKLRPGTLRLGQISVVADGYTTTPRLIFARHPSHIPEENGLTVIPESSIEIQPGQLFLNRLTLTFHWKKNTPKMGWYRYDTVKKKWKYRDTELNPGKAVATAGDFRNGTYGVFLDHAAPVIHKNPYYYRNRTAWHITDVGKGVDDRTITLSKSGKKWQMEYDPDRKIAWIDSHLRKGRYKIRVKDLAGNIAEATGTLH